MNFKCNKNSIIIKNNIIYILKINIFNKHIEREEKKYLVITNK